MNSIRTAILVSLLAAATAMAAVDPALMNLVMPDAKILSGIQVDQSAASPFGRYVLSQMQPDPGFLQFVTATGFDPRRDLHEILIATAADASAAGHGVLIAGRGSFQPGQLAAAATAAGGIVTQYQGVSVLTAPDQKSTGSVAFLDPTTAVMGDIDTVKAAIDRRLSSSTYSGALARKANEVSSLNQAWFATLTPLSDFLNGKIGDPNLNNMTHGNLLQAVQQASGGVTFGPDSIILSGDAVTRSAQDAQALVDVMRFLAGMVQTKAASLADAATFTADGAVMHFAMVVPEQQAEQLFIPPSGAHAAARAKKSR